MIYFLVRILETGEEQLFRALTDAKGRA